ncbi:proline racemase [Alkalispirochaeta odontotermitis]|nr:proline racemase [Alkalispirochaeta odontotermitis]CAB1069242.1 trans-3-hydroxy-L-proline dehydratase (EC [Olavius algarvensis Delta 1 endosymbiont]
MKNWRPPDHWLKITTIDAHTAGEPFRVITGGLPDLPGDTILARRRHMKNHLDHLRTALMWEPRGHADMYGCIITPPVTPGADFGILFLHNEGYSTMCGHGIIGIVKVALETGLVPQTAPATTLRIDSPAGLVTAHARIAADKIQGICFENVPSFVLALDEVIDVPGVGKIRYDIAFGGAFYAYVRAADIGLTCTPRDFAVLVQNGMAIKRAVMDTRRIPHPFEEDLSFLYGTIFIGPPESETAHSRNVCIFAEGEVDRSPTGTGVSGRLAIHHARREIDLNQTITIESIIGTCFSGRIIQETTFGPHAAVIPQIEGSAHITGRHEFLIDPDDPLKEGFILR